MDSIDFKNNFPRHIAVIMDGNGRWAKRRFLPRALGHKQGVQTVRNIVRAAHKLKIEVLSLYAFSTENWKRPPEEISALFDLLLSFIKKDFEEFNQNKVKLRILGDLSKFPQYIKTQVEEVIEKTANNDGLQLNIALNYGSREELLRVFKLLKEKNIDIPSQQDISDLLYTAGQPDPDLLIRTSGEKRISNFLLWQAAYCELYFTDKLWPDFDEKDLEAAIIDYQKRQRRFGGI